MHDFSRVSFAAELSITLVYNSVFVKGEVNIKDALPQDATVGTTLTIVMQNFLQDGIHWGFHVIGTIPHHRQGSHGLRSFAP